MCRRRRKGRGETERKRHRGVIVITAGDKKDDGSCFRKGGFSEKGWQRGGGEVRWLLEGVVSGNRTKRGNIPKSPSKITSRKKNKCEELKEKNQKRDRRNL